MTLKIVEENNSRKALKDVDCGSVVYPNTGCYTGSVCLVLSDSDYSGRIGLVPLAEVWEVHYEDPDTTVDVCEAKLSVTR